MNRSIKWRQPRFARQLHGTILVGLAAMALSTAGYGQGFMVKPMMMRFQPRPGETVQQDLELSSSLSEGTQALTVKVFELGQSAGGGWLLLDPEDEQVDTSNLRSCREWLELSAASVRVEPMQAGKVTVKLTPPRQAWGFYGAALIAESEPEARGGTIAIRIRFLIPVLVEIRGRTPRQNIGLTSIGMHYIETTEQRPGTTQVSLGISNDGNTYARLTGKMNIMRQAGERWQRVATADFGQVGIIPGITLGLIRDLQRRLPSGKYKLQATLGIEGRPARQLSEEIDFIGDPTVTDVAADVALILDPTTLFITGVPGSRRSVVLKVENSTEETISLRGAVLVPSVLRSASSSEVKGTDLSCAEWTRVAPDEFTLRPRGRQNIRVSASLPADNILANYYGTLYLQGRYPDGGSAGETTALVWVQNTQAEPLAVAQGMNLSLAREEGDKYVVTATFGNTGNIHWTSKCRATLTTTTDKTVVRTQLEGPENWVLPLEIVQFSGLLDFSKLEPDTYYLAAIMEYGERQNATQVLPIELTVEDDQKVVTVVEPEATQ